MKGFKAYAPGHSAMAETPRAAAIKFFTMYPTKRKCDVIAGVEDAPVKAKRTRKAAKAMPEKSAVMWLLMDHGLTMYQANPLADKLLALFGGDA